jgi:hypothetical protein
VNWLFCFRNNQNRSRAGNAGTGFFYESRRDFAKLTKTSTRPMKSLNSILCALLLLFLFSNTFAQSTSVTEVYPLIVQFRADRGSLDRFYFIQNSPERRERLKVFYKDYLSKLEQLPFESMSVSGRADYLLTKRDFENELDLLNKEEKEVKQVEKICFDRCSDL